jgi:hypothetical protein
LSPSDQELGAKALTNAAFDSHAVHFTRARTLPDRECAASGGGGFRRWYRAVTDSYFKAPQLQEQEYRTALATLRIGERFVRDRGGVCRERVRMLRAPGGPEAFTAQTREVIERVRSQPLYLPPPSAVEPPKEALPDAALRLQRLAESE